MAEKLLDVVDLGIPIETLRKTKSLNTDLKAIGLNPFELKIIIRTSGAGKLVEAYERKK